MLGFAGIFWAIDGGGFGDAVVVSGSSLFTLGFERPDGVGGAIVAFACATIGLGLLALVITYLPTLNSAFSRRESVVAMLDTRAGSPPNAITLIERHHVFAGIETLDALWPEWERWIVDVGETHYTHPMLVFFRSSEPRALVGDRDGDAARGGELPALVDRRVGRGERGGVDVLPGAVSARCSGSAASSRTASPTRDVEPVDRGRSSSAFSSTSRRSA